MTHFIDEKNVYHIQKNGKDVLTIELDSIEGHVIIKNEKEVFAGPVDLLSFAN